MPATRFADLPILPDRNRAYQASDVEPRVRAWASSDGSGDPDTIDYEKFRRAFLWYDSSNPDRIGSYRLKIADVVDGRLVAIWRGITTIAAVMQGSRGGTTIPDADRGAVRSQVEKYYAKAANVFDDPSIEVPWEQNMSRSEPEPYARSWALDGIEILRAEDGYGDGRTVEAYAAVFDIPTEITDRYGHYNEVIDRRAFNRQIGLGVDRVGVYYHHAMTLHGTPSDLGSVPIGSPVDIRADGRGLRTVTRYNRSPLADSVLEAIRNGDIRGYSFRGAIYKSNPAKVPRVKAGQPLPTVRRTELGLTEYGPTPTPAYADAGILAVRALQMLASSTPGQHDRDQGTTTATPEPGPGAEDQPERGHSGRQRLLRLKAGLRERGV